MKINPNEIEWSFSRSPGPGGQNVNKVATAAQLRFDVLHSKSLSEAVRTRLCKLAASKITQEGELIIKANRYRSQERNKHDALQRLQILLQSASIVPKKRKKTAPSLAKRQQRLANKKSRGETKILRRKVTSGFEREHR